ncbi:unnamed protein product [Pleuronectes platessa]|uniref:Uncharacterized protein n=1 Tax=Pleuronectes platessa TaxID=8262 RepID=A0A9N7UJU5_PLEPL|nr:unnamed protein product [Pleuronectes platessa]
MVVVAIMLWGNGLLFKPGTGKLTKRKGATHQGTDITLNSCHYEVLGARRAGVVNGAELGPAFCKPGSCLLRLVSPFHPVVELNTGSRKRSDSSFSSFRLIQQR